MRIIGDTIIVFFLIISGIGKIIDPTPAMLLLEKLPLVPNSIILPIVSIMPILELIVAAGIVFKYKKLLTYTLNLCLFSCFLIISIYATYLRIHDDCGCFGAFFESKVGWSMIIRNLVFLAISIYLFIINNKKLVVKKLKRTELGENA